MERILYLDADLLCLNDFRPFYQMVMGAALYGHQILSVPDQLYNYDARYNILYYSRSRGEWDLDWVINHTVFLHFCGRDKPWLKGYTHRYSGLYKQYAKQAQDLLKRDQDQQ